MIGSKFKKKRMLGLFIVLLALGLSSLTADTPRTLYTPRNTLVPDTYVMDEWSVAERDSIDCLYDSLYPNAEQLKLWGEQYSSSRRYNCHGYAWHMIGDDAINDTVWIGYYSPGQVNKYWEDGSYDEVSSSIATIVKYSGDHSATTTDQADIYISKWRWNPLMRHHKDYHPGYGTPDKFLIRSVDVPQDYSTIQAAINAAVSGQTVHVSSGTYSENITMKSGVDVDGTNNVTIDGNVYFNSVSNAKLQDVTVTETIFVNNNSSGIDIDRVDRIYSYGCGIDLYNSSADIWQFDISNNTKGIYSHGSSVADISYCDITDITWGLKLYGSTSTDVWGMGFCNNNYDIWLEEGGYIWIEEDNMMFSGDAEEVTWGVPYEDLPEYYDICLGKIIPTADVAAQEETNPAGRGGVSTTAAEGGIEYELGAEILRGISKKIRLLKQADQPIDRQAYAAEYVEAISHFKEVIQKYPDSPLAVNALPRIRSCFWVLDQPEQLADYVNSLINDSKYQAIKPYAQYLLIPYLLYKEDYDLTLQLSDEILAGPPNDVLACEVLYGKGIIYQHYLNDLEAAAEIYRQVIAEYPDHPTALSAQAELENMGEEYVPGDSTSTQLVSGEPVIVSYPNPFNPTVMIRFSLPEASSLQLTVYDIMGREVIRLVDGYMEAGRQQVVWNGKTAGGRNVPTGIYIVRLITPAATRNIKLVLLK